MSPVGGSRHYDGAGLGQVLTWTCPSCGAENAGPITQGCSLCGAGKPGQKAEADPPPPPPHDQAHYDQARGDFADDWARHHEDATIAEAYRRGYQAGIRAARVATPPTSAEDPDVNQKITRTICVALAMFRDHVLVNTPEEIETGEWLSAEETTRLIRRLQLEMREPAHV